MRRLPRHAAADRPVNVIAAWPAPEAIRDAVVCLRHTETEAADPEHTRVPSDEPEADDFVPEDVLDQLEAAKAEQRAGRHLRKYWRFLGFRDDPALKSYLADIASRRPCGTTLISAGPGSARAARGHAAH